MKKIKLVLALTFIGLLVSCVDKPSNTTGHSTTVVTDSTSVDSTKTTDVGTK